MRFFKAARKYGAAIPVVGSALFSTSASAAITVPPLAAADFADIVTFLEGSAPAIVSLGVAIIAFLALISVLRWARGVL